LYLINVKKEQVVKIPLIIGGMVLMGNYGHLSARLTGNCRKIPGPLLT
jgi:hypothetical protein